VRGSNADLLWWPVNARSDEAILRIHTHLGEVKWKRPSQASQTDKRRWGQGHCREGVTYLPSSQSLAPPRASLAPQRTRPEVLSANRSRGCSGAFRPCDGDGFRVDGGPNLRSVGHLPGRSCCTRSAESDVSLRFWNWARKYRKVPWKDHGFGHFVEAFPPARLEARRRRPRCRIEGFES
jgi:hypothetical protein